MHASCKGFKHQLGEKEIRGNGMMQNLLQTQCKREEVLHQIMFSCKVSFNHDTVNLLQAAFQRGSNPAEIVTCNQNQTTSVWSKKIILRDS